MHKGSFVMDYEYLLAGKLKRGFIRIRESFKSFPSRALLFFINLPRNIGAVFIKIYSHFKEIVKIFVLGDMATKLSFVVMGMGCIARKRFIRGFLYLLLQVLFWFFFLTFGVVYIAGLGTLGTVSQLEVYNEGTGIFEYVKGDNSMLILLYGIVSLFLVVLYIALYFSSIRECYRTEMLKKRGGQIPFFSDDVQDLMDKDFHKSLIFVPSVMIICFTILPIIFMVCLAFTNYDRLHMPPGNLFTWVGFENFRSIMGFSDSSLLAKTFGKILGWTFVWAFFATGTNYIFGMLLAMMINKKGIKFKRLFRTVFVLTIAVPQFVSLMFMRNVFADTGLFNVFLQSAGIISEPVKFLTDGDIARVVVIFINMWVGIPYTMLITTGILMNIPNDLYESARIDGAGTAKQFFAITLPYMLFVTAPYLITQFIGNINNFNVIWLLTNGGPMTSDMYASGRTDLLITWLYRLTTGEQNYKIASVIGIFTFIISAVFSLIVYNYSGSARREGEFQ